MNFKKISKWLVGGLLLALLLLSVATPAQAFESRGGDNVVIAAGEVIEDDLYVGANTFTLEGTVQGDLIAMGSTITIGPSGVVEGDFMGAGQVVVIEGTVEDDVRIGGMVLTVAEGAEIGDDLVGAGYSLESEAGSTIDGDLVVFGAQSLLAGDVAGDVSVAAEGLELNGRVGGNVDAEVGDPAEAPPFSPTMFIPNIPPIPSVSSGLTIGSAARIEGKLTYTAAQVADIPEETVVGSVTHLEPAVEAPDEEDVQVPTPGARILDLFLKLARNLVTLLVVGLFMAWLVPDFMRYGAEKLRSKPLHSFGWGIVAYIVFLILFFLVVFVTIFLAIVLGMITLGVGDLVRTTIGAGVAAFSTLGLTFNVSVTYISKIFVSYLVGRLLLAQLKPDLAEHRAWPMVIGVVIFAILITIPYLGWFINLLVVLLGLGALWLLGLEWWQSRSAAPLPA